MGRFLRLGVALAFLLPATAAAQAEPDLSPLTKITSIRLVNGFPNLRFSIVPFPRSFNPAECPNPHAEFFDIEIEPLAGDSRAREELLDAVFLAYMTGRSVRLLVDANPATGCSTLGTTTTSRFRMAVGLEIEEP